MTDPWYWIELGVGGRPGEVEIPIRFYFYFCLIQSTVWKVYYCVIGLGIVSIRFPSKGSILLTGFFCLVGLVTDVDGDVVRAV